MHTSKTTKEAVRALKLLTNENRFKIIDLLKNKRNGMCVHEIAEAIGMSHSATSHQLTNLENRGVLESFRRGQSMCYSLADTTLSRTLISIIKQCRTCDTQAIGSR